MYYKVVGKGRPMLLIHGFGADGRIFYAIRTQLAQNFQLIIPDLPGFGRSKMIENWSIESVAEQIMRDLECYKLKDVVVVGHSMGGYIALEMVIQYPNRFGGLVLMNSHPYADSDDRLNNRRKAIQFLNKFGKAPYVKEMHKAMFADGFLQDRKDVRELMELMSETFETSTLVQVTEALMNRKSYKNDLSHITIPVLVIAGGKDTTFNAGFVWEQCAAYNNVKIGWLEDSGHTAPLEHPEHCVMWLKALYGM